MKRRGVLTALAAIACVMFAQPSQAQDLGSLDGTWEGTLTFVTDDQPSNVIMGNSPVFRLQIQGAEAHVFADFRGNGFREVKPGLFTMDRVGPSAVITAMDSGRDNEGVWVETWSFSVTLASRDELMTRYVRVVNNTNLPPGSDHSKFGVLAHGTLHRATL